GDLRQISPEGKVRTVAARLSDRNPPPANVSDLNYHMGLWLDREGNVCVAVAIERLVLRVGTDGATKVIARSGQAWSPSGGMFDREENLWLLEYDSTNAVRARRIARDGHERIFPAEEQK